MRIMTHFKTQIITLVPVAQSLSVRPIFASSESEEFISYIGVGNRLRQCTLRPVFRFEMVISFIGGFKMKNLFSLGAPMRLWPVFLTIIPGKSVHYNRYEEREK